MRPHYLFTRIIPTLLLIIIIVQACKKSSSADSQDQEAFAAIAVATNSDAELVFDDVFDNVMGVNDEVAIGGTGVFGRKAMTQNDTGDDQYKLTGADSTTCFTVAITQLTATRFPLEATIDFGSGCTGKDGRTRRGKLIIRYTGRLIIPGNSATTTFDGYSVDSISVEGIQTVTNTSSPNTRSFSIEVKDAKLSKSNGDYSEWNSTRTITQTGGLGTPLIAPDDVFSLTGRASGSVQRNDKLYLWATSITEPLVKRFACRWIVKGTIAVQKGSSTVAVFDYGTGICDNKASFSVNGRTHEITLH